MKYKILIFSYFNTITFEILITNMKVFFKFFYYFDDMHNNSGT